MKFVALFMSFILVVAIIGWVTPIVEALVVEGTGTKIFDLFNGGDFVNNAEFNKELVNIFNSVDIGSSSIKHGDIYFYELFEKSKEEGKQQELLDYLANNKDKVFGQKDDDDVNGKNLLDAYISAGMGGAVDGEASVFRDIDLGDFDSVTFDKDKDKITVKKGDVERVVSLKDVPDNVRKVELVRGPQVPDFWGEETPYSVVYSMGDDEGTIVVNNADTTLASHKDGKTVLRGVVGPDVTINLEKDGYIWIDDDKEVSYRGANTEVALGAKHFKAVDGKDGSVEFVNDGEGVIIKNSRFDYVEGADNKVGEYTLVVGEDEDGKGIFFGDGEIPKGMEKRSLNFKDNELSGNLEELGDEEEITFKKEGPEDVTIGESILGDQKIDVLDKDNPQVTFKKIKGKVEAEVGTGTLTTATATSNGDEPNLPTAGTPGVGDNETKNGTKKNQTRPPVNPPTPPSIVPPKGINWGLIGLIVAGIIGVMIVMSMFGGEENETAEDTGIDDGGAMYMGPDNETVSKEIRSSEGRDNKSLLYNPSERAGSSCDANSSGYYNCPDDDCSRCTSINPGNGPIIQDADEEEDTSSGSGNESGNTTN